MAGGQCKIISSVSVGRRSFSSRLNAFASIFFILLEEDSLLPANAECRMTNDDRGLIEDQAIGGILDLRSYPYVRCLRRVCVDSKFYLTALDMSADDMQQPLTLHTRQI